MKAKIGEAIMENWLEKDENLDMWHESISAKKRRILMTQWTGEAWRNALLSQDVCEETIHEDWLSNDSWWI